MTEKSDHPDAELLAAYERMRAAWDRDDDEAASAHRAVRRLPAQTVAGAVVKLRAALLARGIDDDDDGRAMREAAEALERPDELLRVLEEERDFLRALQAKLAEAAEALKRHLGQGGG
jgi:hypothetical protein